MSCDGIHNDPKCWTKATDHCSRCGRKLAPGDYAYQHLEMLNNRGRAPVWCAASCEPFNAKDWELFQIREAEQKYGTAPDEREYDVNRGPNADNPENAAQR